MKYLKVLNTNRLAIVDDSDFERCLNIQWALTKNGYIRGTWSGERVFLHRFIYWLFPGDKDQVDHWDGDTFNNQSYNLRLCNQFQNTGNRQKQKGTTSKYKGVSWNIGSNKWQVYISNKCIGHFQSEIEAANAYNLAALQVWGKFAKLNEI